MKKIVAIVSLALSLSACHPEVSFNNFPKGSIIAWASKEKIPKGWLVCDGGNGTPNLINRIPYGTANSSEIGDTLGSSTHIHKVNIKSTNLIFDGDKPVGGNVGSQRNGDNEQFHKHKVIGTTEPTTVLPPATKVIFIMKS